MKGTTKIILMLTLCEGALALAWASAKNAPPVQPQNTASTIEVNQDWMSEGEKRYRINCARCHQAPHRFPPRAMATVVRHMRVRAMLTEDDMKYVLYYMSH